MNDTKSTLGSAYPKPLELCIKRPTRGASAMTAPLHKRERRPGTGGASKHSTNSTLPEISDLARQRQQPTHWSARGCVRPLEPPRW